MKSIIKNLNLFCYKNQVILFYGSKGWIGSLFMDYIKQNHPSLKVIEGSSRIENRTDVLIELGVHRPTHVISFTGRTHGTIDGQEIGTIDYLEYPGRLTENICDNLFGPVQLAQICQQKEIHYTYLGTGCIFNSERIDTINPETFSEDSLPNYFGSSYSIVKGFTDRLMHNMFALNLRIRMPISKQVSPRNFINKITGYKKICSVSNSMTVLDDFFPIFMDLILKEKTGTWNCTNPGTISHNEILDLYRQFVQPDFTWENFTIEEQSLILKSDRSNNALDTTKLEKHYKIDNIYDSVKRVLQKFKLN